MGKFITRKKIIVSALAVVFLTMAMTVIWFQFSSTGSKKTVDEASMNYDSCLNDGIGARLKNEFPWFTAASVESMKDIIANIEALPNLDKAINCQYILAKHDAFRGDTKGTLDHYQKVISIYESDGRWVDIAVGTNAPDDVRKLITVYKENADLLIGQVEKNRIKWTTE